MSAAGKGKPGFEGGDADAGKVHRIRITLSSRNVANLEKGTPFFLLSFLPSSLPLTSAPFRPCATALGVAHLSLATLESRC